MVDVLNECYAEGFAIVGNSQTRAAMTEAAQRLDISRATLASRLEAAQRLHGIKPDPEQFQPKPKPEPKPLFTVDPLPNDGEPSAEELIEQLTRRHRDRANHHDAAKLRQVQVQMDGPVALAFFGDPHIDDPGCAWGDLEPDVAICRDTPGIMAVNVGDTTNNWVGRLMGIYAQQEVTTRQALTLIEWLMTSLPWLLWEDGNHDLWNTQKGDVTAVMHKLLGRAGIHNEGGTRMQLNLPSGCDVKVHVRHDFPGGSQFNPAHALVRETLFGYRDHIMACGHRHTAGYIPVWHNDPQRLCHGLRIGTYKDFDHYAAEKGFQHGNWARSMGTVIDPDYAHDPVRYVRTFFSLEEMGEYLTWRREKWSLGKTHA
jgi:hypothetical protein